jgi:hypothetical protein
VPDLSRNHQPPAPAPAGEAFAPATNLAADLDWGVDSDNSPLTLGGTTEPNPPQSSTGMCGRACPEKGTTVQYQNSGVWEPAIVAGVSTNVGPGEEVEVAVQLSDGTVRDTTLAHLRPAAEAVPAAPAAASSDAHQQLPVGHGALCTRKGDGKGALANAACHRQPSQWVISPEDRAGYVQYYSGLALVEVTWRPSTPTMPTSIHLM